MDENPDTRTLITLADLKGFLKYMDARKPHMGVAGGDSARSLIVYLIKYIESEVEKA